MKKTTVILFLVCIVYAGAFAQQSIYVSARGNDNNDGQSEAKPFKSLDKALELAAEKRVSRITVIGTLTKENYSVFEEGDFFVFLLEPLGFFELLITGKPGTTGTDRAVLSAKGSGTGSVRIGISSAKIRFEHIEISGGESILGSGLSISNGASVTLGQGVVVRGNYNYGIDIDNGTCVIDGGEIRDNLYFGIGIGEAGIVTMRNGTIKDNRSSDIGGGVVVYRDGRFTMSGGTITNNQSSGIVGGGVYVLSGGRFDQTGGTISGNTIYGRRTANVIRDRGSLGSDLVTSGSR